MLLINNYTKRVWIKPEGPNSTWLDPGKTSNIDGFKPPKWGADWLKLSNKFDSDGKCVIDRNGDFKLYNYNYGFLHSNSAIFKTKILYDHLPGRKKDPYSTWRPEPKQ